jgi:uncharacterized protein YijF (DUF1287 family)
MGLNRRTALGMLVATPMFGVGEVFARPAQTSSGERLAQAARGQVGVTKAYDPSYRAIPYPNGDVLRSTGVCADVLVRAARDAWRVDLQQLIHEDMTRNFDAYPSRRVWGLKGPDSNIDHRRVLNLETYLVRQRAQLAVAPPKTAGDRFDDPIPGDIMTWRVWGGISAWSAKAPRGCGWSTTSAGAPRRSRCGCSSSTRRSGIIGGGLKAPGRET